MKAAPMGMTTRKIMVVPCIVNTWLYRSALSSLPLGRASCRRMWRASTPPKMKKNMAAAPYMIAIFLWSTVVTQLRQPVVDEDGRVKTPSGRCCTASPAPRARGPSMAVMTCSFLLQSAQEGDQIIDLVFGQVEVGHAAAERAGHGAGIHVLLGGRVAQPGFELRAVEALGDARLGGRPSLAVGLA